MSPRRAALSVTLLISLIPVVGSAAQIQQPVSDIPTIHATSTLVFLDVTVLDKKGRPVVTGLTQDDFTITEDKKPQRIFSFEAPESHATSKRFVGDSPYGSGPRTIFVLDLLNSSFEDFAFICYSMQQYLQAQPQQLDSPSELMVIGNQSLELIQGYTRSREDLLFAMKHLPAVLPYKEMNGAFYADRFVQSIQALQQIALQNHGIPGRKNIIWVGHGGPGLDTVALGGKTMDRLNQFIHRTTNMLVDARIGLFVIYPGLKVSGGEMTLSAGIANSILGNDDPFAADINFGIFVNETGGKLFYNRNDVDALIGRSQKLGSEYYTLTYQPHEGDADGRFRRIRIALRNPNLEAITKAGYFAPSTDAPADPLQETMLNLIGATQTTIPFTDLDMKISNVERHPDTHTASFTVLLRSKNLNWESMDDGNSKIQLHLAAASLSGSLELLASKMEAVTVFARSQDRAALAKEVIQVNLTVRIPNRTQSVRVAIETEDEGLIGAADLDRKAINAAPATPTLLPQTILRPATEKPVPLTR